MEKSKLVLAWRSTGMLKVNAISLWIFPPHGCVISLFLSLSWSQPRENYELQQNGRCEITFHDSLILSLLIFKSNYSQAIEESMLGYNHRRRKSRCLYLTIPYVSMTSSHATTNFLHSQSTLCTLSISNIL